MPSLLWIRHIPADDYIVVTPPYWTVVSNASLGYELGGDSGKGSLRLGRADCDEVLAIASFSKDACENVRLELVLEPNVEYAFCVTGPFSVDLIGYYRPNGVEHSSAASQTFSSQTSPGLTSPAKDQPPVAAHFSTRTTSSADNSTEQSRAAAEAACPPSPVTGKPVRKPRGQQRGQNEGSGSKKKKTTGGNGIGPKTKKPTGRNEGGSKTKKATLTPAALERRASLCQLASRAEPV